MGYTWVCSECMEPIEGGRPTDTIAPGTDPARLGWRHKDGTQLCPVMTNAGYQPALPKGAGI